MSREMKTVSCWICTRCPSSMPVEHIHVIVTDVDGVKEIFLMYDARLFTLREKPGAQEKT